MEFIKLNKENIKTEHICCAISNENDIQVKTKKRWLTERLDEGLVFLKADVRGKCFIEYIPAEYACVPVKADGYMYINCLWVSGQFKNQGYSSLLLDECIADSKAKGKKGLVTLSSAKKLGFLADKKYLLYKGFSVCDTAEPSFELMYMDFDEANATSDSKPCFMPQCKTGKLSDGAQEGFTLYYTDQCPFTAKYVPILADVFTSRKVELKTAHIDSLALAKAAPCPFTAFSLYYNGDFITHEIPSVAKLEKLLTQMGF